MRNILMEVEMELLNTIFRRDFSGFYHISSSLSLSLFSKGLMKTDGMGGVCSKYEGELGQW
jgi:hypothetical protein